VVISLDAGNSAFGRPQTSLGIRNIDGLHNCSNSAGDIRAAVEADDSNQAALWAPFVAVISDVERTGILPPPSTSECDAPVPDEADRAAVAAAAAAAAAGQPAPTGGVRCKLRFVGDYKAVSALMGIGAHNSAAYRLNAWAVNRDGVWHERTLNHMLTTGNGIVGAECRCCHKVFASADELEVEARHRTQMLADPDMDRAAARGEPPAREPGEAAVPARPAAQRDVGADALQARHVQVGLLAVLGGHRRPLRGAGCAARAVRRARHAALA
jgi:hypothetical protein